MKAGRELDALVAEKVMELNVQPCRKIGEPLAIANEAGHFERFIPHYSTDIAAAWEVLGVALTWRFSRRLLFFEAIKGECFTTGFEQVNGWWMLQHLYPRFPEVVCLAALRAKGINV